MTKQAELRISRAPPSNKTHSPLLTATPRGVSMRLMNEDLPRLRALLTARTKPDGTAKQGYSRNVDELKRRIQELEIRG